MISRRRRSSWSKIADMPACFDFYNNEISWMPIKTGPLSVTSGKMQMIIFFKRLEAKQSSPKSVDRVQLSLRDFLDSLFNSLQTYFPLYKQKARLLPKGFEGYFYGHFTDLITGYFVSRYSWIGGGGHGHKCRALNALNIYKWCRPQSPKVLLPFSSSSAQTRSLVPASEKLSGQLTLLLYLPTRSIYRY